MGGKEKVGSVGVGALGGFLRAQRCKSWVSAAAFSAALEGRGLHL